MLTRKQHVDNSTASKARPSTRPGCPISVLPLDSLESAASLGDEIVDHEKVSTVCFPDHKNPSKV